MPMAGIPLIDAVVSAYAHALRERRGRDWMARVDREVLRRGLDLKAVQQRARRMLKEDKPP